MNPLELQVLQPGACSTIRSEGLLAGVQRIINVRTIGAACAY